MSQLEFKFDKENFDRLFPFYILIDKFLNVVSLGKSISKLQSDIKINDHFTDYFNIHRPHVEEISASVLHKLTHQFVIISIIGDKLTLRGQFEIHDSGFLFIGSPWFSNMNEVIEKNLTVTDFAINDTLIDMLHIINNHEVTTVELKETLGIINNQKNKLKKDKEELNRLALVASVNHNGVIFTKPNGEIFWSNDAYLNLTGYTKEEVLGKTPIEVGFCEMTSKESVQSMIKPYFRGESFDFDLIHGRKDGSSFWSRAKGQPIKNSKGEIIEYFAILEDITEEKNAQNKTLESENRLSTLIVNLHTGILLKDQNRKILLANKRFCSMFGIPPTPEQLIGQDYTDFANQTKHLFKSAIDFKDRTDRILKDKQAVHKEELELVDGRIFQRNYIPIYREGKYNGHLWTFDDITFKKRYSESLEIERAKYQSIITNMNLGLLEVDLDDRITLANNNFCEISGYSITDLIGKEAANLFLTADSKQLLESKKELRTGGISNTFEVKVKNKKGEYKTWLISGAPNYNLQGELIGSIGTHLDITQQKEQEEKLYLLSLIAEKNINTVIICDNQGRIEWVNNSFIEMSGYTLEEVIGKKPGQILQGPETNPETVSYMKDKISKGLPFNCEVVNYSKNGEKYWIKIQGQALYNKDGEILKFFAMEEDVTDKKLLEQQTEELLQSLAKSNQELEDYAQIVSHDLKSPLRSIHSLLSWIKEDNDKELSDPTLQYIGMIENKVEKMDHLIQGILTYAKIDKGNVAIENVNIHDVVTNIIEIIDIPENTKIVIKNQLPIIEADKYRMQQLFQNIIGNAVNYIDKKEGWVEVEYQEKNKHHVFSIKDNGPGIAKENMNKIFNTFQSFTKSDKSTGLGLSIVKKIIETYQGKIWLESELGVGTTFFIQLKKQKHEN